MLPVPPSSYRSLLAVLACPPLLWSNAHALERDALQRQLAEPAQLQGSFEQRHWLAEQQTRLYSEGHFLYQRGRQLLWRFETPIDATLVFAKLSPDVDPDEVDALPDSETLDELIPERVEFSRHMIDLLGGNWEALEEDYAISLEGDAEEWRARFSPRTPALETELSEMLLSGGALWNSLEMKAADGDELLIRFSDVGSMVDEALSDFLSQWLVVDIEDIPDDEEDSDDEDDADDDVIAEEVDPEELDEETRADEDDDDGEDDDDDDDEEDDGGEEEDDDDEDDEDDEDDD